MATAMAAASAATPNIMDQPIPSIMDLPVDMETEEDHTANRNASLDKSGHAMVEQSRLKIEKLSLLGEFDLFFCWLVEAAMVGFML